MRIDSSTIGMESNRSYRATSVVMRRFTISSFRQELTEDDETLDAATEENAEGSEEDVKDKAQQSVAALEDWRGRLQMAGSGVKVRSSASQTVANIRQATVRYIFDLLFRARQERLSRWLGGGNNQNWSSDSQTLFSQNTSQGNSQSSQNSNSGAEAQPATFINMKVINFSQSTIQMEAEDTAFSTVGTVRTSDGREINFNVNVGMSREFQQYYEESHELGSFVMCDPLVINLDTDMAKLSDQTFYFDIDADGELDEVSRLGAGSGYLALDKNGDGIINDGSELFGTASGNGFADLAKYDEDGNGWIDENDAIWDKLKIWCKDENGKDLLYKLSDKGVGAICLQNVSTDFTLKGQEGQTKGAVRNTGVFLYEDGNVGTVQHVDVAKYDAQA